MTKKFFSLNMRSLVNPSAQAGKRAKNQTSQNYSILFIAILLLISACSDETEIITPLNASKVHLPKSELTKLALPDSLTNIILEPANSVTTQSKGTRSKGVGARAQFDPFTAFGSLGTPGQGNTNTATAMQISFSPFGGRGSGAATEADCPLFEQEEPRTYTGANGLIGICLARAIKSAIKRVSADYANAVSIIYSVGSQLGDVPQDQVVQYTNPDVDTDSGKGITIQFKYSCTLNCASTDESIKTYHHTLGITPLSDTTKMIGRMEWDVMADGSASGHIIIDKGLMKGSIGWVCTNSRQLCGGPSQIDYTFSSDPNGQAQNFEMKYLSDPTDEFRHEATFVRMNRRAANATTGEPAVWIVQGIAPYQLAFPINPARDDVTYHPGMMGFPVNLVFNAVAEDITQGGKAVFDAVFADDQQNILPRSTQLTAADRQTAHVWATYKKILKANYTPQFYAAYNSGSNVVVFPVAPDAPMGQQRTSVYNRYRLSITANANDFTISADAKRIVTAGRDGLLKVFDIDPLSANPFAAQLLSSCSPNGGAELISVRLSADGTEALVAGADRTAHRINLSNCTNVASFAFAAGTCTTKIIADYGSDGNIYLAGAGTNNAIVQQWNSNGTLIKQKAMDHYAIIVGAVTTGPSQPTLCPIPNTIQLNPDQSSVLTSYDDATARIWNLNTENELVLKHISQYTDSFTGAVTPVYTGFYVANVFAIFNPDGTEVISSVGAGSDWDQMGIFRWSATPPTTTREVVSTFIRKEATESTLAIRYSPDNNILMGSNGSSFRVNSKTAVPTGNAFTYIAPTYYLPYVVTRSIAVLPNSENRVGLVIDSAGNIRARAILERAAPDDLAFSGHLGQAMTVQFSQSGKRLVSGGVDGVVKVWATQTGAPIATLAGHGANASNPSITGIRSAVFVDNDTKILSAGSDQTIRLWDANTGQQLWQVTGIPINVTSADANPSFTLIAASSADGNVRLYSTAGILVGTLPNRHTGSANAVAFSPSDSSVLAEHGNDGVLNVWDVSNPTSPILLKTQLVQTTGTTTPRSIALSTLKYARDGTRLFAGGDDYGGHIFDASIPATLPSTPLSIPEIATPIPQPYNYPQSVTPFPAPGDTRVLTTAQFSQVGNEVRSNEILSWDYTIVEDPNTTFWDRLRALYYDGLYAQYTNSVYGTDVSSDGTLIAAGYAGGRFNSSWVDFDGLWMRNHTTANAILGIWADEGDAVNPYHIYPTTNNSASMCYMVDVDTKLAGTPSCKQTCADIPGGCYYQDVVSTYRSTALGTNSPIATLDYTALEQILSGLENNWYTTSYSNVVIPPVQ